MTLGAAPLASFPPFSYQYYQEKLRRDATRNDEGKGQVGGMI